MPTKLLVTVSSPETAYPPSQPIDVNSPTPTRLTTPGFEGNIWVFVKDYHGEHTGGDGAEYFEGPGRGGMTYGIVVKGFFKGEKGVGADEVVFGNVFEKPIKESLPWGTSVATKFMYFVDPTLELDIYADKPWALSPAFATMNYLSIRSGGSGGDGGAGEADKSLLVKEDTIDFLVSQAEQGPAEGGNEKARIGARRKWLGKKENREKIKLGPKDEVGMEFANGLLDFNTLSATLPPPFNTSFPLLKYWDGQPVVYTCQRKAPAGESPVGGQEVFWSVGFEIVDEDAKKGLEKRAGGKGHKQVEGKGEKEEVSEDVD